MLNGNGGASPYSFAVTNGSLPPNLSLPSAGLLSGTLTTLGTYNFTVTATAANGCQGRATYDLVVTCPTLTLSSATLPNGTYGTAYNQSLTASGDSTYTFRVTGGALPPGLNLLNGVFSGTPTAVGNYSFTITAYGFNNLCSGSQTYNFTINCPTVSLTPATLLSVSVGTAYNQTLSATPANNYSFAITQGALPPGLLLSTTGTISGTPTAAGNYAFAITATGFGGCTGTQAYSLLVTDACTTIALTPASLPGGTLGAAYNQTVSAIGGTAPYTFSVASGALPPGLTLDATTGALSGTLTASGTFALTLKATGQGGCFGTRAYIISIACATVTLTTVSPLPNATVGVAYNQAFAASPATAYTFSLQTGSLPPGFTLSSAGVLSGVTMQSGTYNFTVKALAGSCAGTRAYTLTIGTGTQAARSTRASTVALAMQPDYDGDGKADTALWTPGTGVWSIRMSGHDQQSITQSWGAAGDVPLLGDYDGDGKTDLAVFRPSAGTFYIKRSSDGGLIVKPWGLSTDVPVPGDYDGDGQTDVAVWRGSEGVWYIVRSFDGMIETQAWGASYAPYNDVPVPGDYDGDGKTDVAVFRRATGTWLIKRSSDGQYIVKAFGTGTDTLVAADYDDDGVTDIAVWRGGTWFIWQSATRTARVVECGTLGDQTVAGDYDGDGQADVAVCRAGTWFIKRSSDGASQTQLHGHVGDHAVGGRL